MSDLTVIIPTLDDDDSKPYLASCLESLKRYSPSVVIQVAANRLPEQGQCRAVNRALAEVRTKYVMVSNDDMVYSPDWEKPLLNAVSKHQCVSPNLVEHGGGAPPFLRVDLGKNPADFDWRRWEEAVEINRSGEAIEDGFNLPFLTETEIFRTIEGYDEHYDPYGSNSDPDVMYKMMIAGIAPKRVRNSLVYHFSRGSSDPVRGDAESQDWWKNWRYFPQKWGFERDGRANIWYAGGENGTRIPTREKPYVAEVAHGHGVHPGQDWLEYQPEWMGKYGPPVHGRGDYYGQ